MMFELKNLNTSSFIIGNGQRLTEEIDESTFDDKHEIAVGTNNTASLVVAICLLATLATLGAAIIAVFSFKEDKLIQRYIQDGEVIMAEIKAMTYIRGNPSSGEEYSVCLDYLRELTKHYSIRIRKRCKLEVKDKEGQSDYMLQNEILIYVLPDENKSGYPKRSIDQKAGVFYRLFSLALVFLFEIISISLFIISSMYILRKTESEDDEYEVKVLNCIEGFFVILSVLIWPGFYYLGNEFINKSLREEYIDNGDILPTDNDDSTISTFESDFSMREERKIISTRVGSRSITSDTKYVQRDDYTILTNC